MVNFYNHNYKSYIAETETIDMTNIYIIFLKYVKPKGVILDLGAGSGRDSRFFLSKNFTVNAVDSSKEMVDYMKQFLGDNVIHTTIESYQPLVTFDGIWASASLLHIKKSNIVKIIRKYISFLKQGGIFYMSFKKGTSEYIENKRFFNCYELEQLKRLLESFDNIEILELFETKQEKKNENQIWVNGIIRLK